MKHSITNMSGRRRARFALLIAGALALLGLAGGVIASPHMTSSLSDYDAPHSAIANTQRQIETVTGANPEENYEIVVHTTTSMTATSALPARVALVARLLKERPEVKQVFDYANTKNPAMISDNGHYTIVEASVGPVNEKTAVAALQTSLDAVPSLKANTWLGGATTADVQIANVSSQDLGRAEIVALPFLILLLFFVFDGLLAAALPLLGALFAIAITLGVMGLVMLFSPLSVFALNLVIALGLGLAVDFSLLIVSRFREEVKKGRSIPDALAIVRRTAGHTVLFSSLTIAAAMLTLIAFPERFVYSMGVAGAAVVLAAGTYALLVLPALLTLFGERIVRGGRRGATHDTEGATSSRWRRWAISIMRRPLLWGATAIIVVVVLATPFSKVLFTGGDAGALPSSSSAGSAYAMTQSKFSTFSEAPAILVVRENHVSPAQLATLTRDASKISGVRGVSSFQNVGGNIWEANVALSSAPLTPSAQRAVRSLETLNAPGSFAVIGQTASFLSMQSTLSSRLPLVLLLILIISVGMLFLMTRSMVLAIMAVVMNLFTVGATFGLLVWGFQWGHLSHVLGFSPPGGLQSTSLVIIFAVVFGLSTDYGVFLLGRIREERLRGASSSESVVVGIERTGKIVTTAACCLALAVGALMMSRLVFVKELGLGVSFAVLLDATLIRGLLVPATMSLLGEAAWSSPKQVSEVGITTLRESM